jgi:GNAT superfamily N-acetyltransferase
MAPAPRRWHRDEFTIDTDPARIDVGVVHGFLTTCYWAQGIPRDVVKRSIDGALCFGIYRDGGEAGVGADGGASGEAGSATGGEADSSADNRAAGEQVGFARVITDYATYAYVGDVFVLEPWRGRGLSKWLMECVTGHPDLQNLRRWVLATRDAHGLYRQFGFTGIPNPERWMHRWDPDVYTRG